MIVHNGKISLSTQGFSDCRDITPLLVDHVRESGVTQGLLTVMISGSTGAVTTIEFESGAISDLKEALEAIAPTDKEYAHNLRWGDGNGFSHVRAALMKPALSIPVVEGKLCLGTWQQVVFLDFDNRPRQRSLVVQVMGKSDRE
ncbi:MAG: secondary thiamine-phosphate synthase enzyme YjbQ [Desulfomonilaceae bacterium]|nr:secondary thiamine-phosphate synthase enzyme YjbQ [Desulfomonilaceae bacterium]